MPNYQQLLASYMNCCFILSLLCLCACRQNQAETSISATPPDVTPSVRKITTPHVDPLAEYMATYKGPVWRDKSNGEKYPLPDSIGGKPVSFYLTNPKVSSLAKALYTSRFRPSDTDSTTQLLMLATTDSKALRPFYRWCLDFTIVISDGALGEYPGAPALAYATKFPQEFFAYMDKDATGERYKRWVEIIAYSGLDSSEAAAKTQKTIADTMTTQCYSCAPQTVSRINTFAKDVASFVQNSN